MPQNKIKIKIIIISATLLALRVILAELLQRIRILLLVPCMARRRAQLLHLVPRRHALSARGVADAGFLCILHAVCHLLRQAVRRRAHRPHHAHPPRPEISCGGAAGPLPWPV
nr:hypothetical protein Saspl_011470 [Ipomoea trifida]